ncbi:DUF4351 domain-containing protein [Clostridium sp. ZS2-4]|uniref:DUF4351 domain-containing protein n=1 Tax=Clostridium sp. ZS2-4 TaxID=2987703 RepID=UPI00227A3AA1|nr:DUF4351 domain-containing protein [Clostridium sp. ZS2-4]MCY6354761.1 DUF4351 domain-containing protein [Clostridium sp. ZS2-4]
MIKIEKLLKEEYIKKDIEQAIKKGKKQELVRSSIRLLTKKFGILPKDIKKKLNKADAITLEIIVDSVLEFNKLEEVSKYLK